MKKTKKLLSGLGLLLSGMSPVYADYTLNLTKGVTKISNEVYDMHMIALGICVFVGLLVFSTMFYSIYFHRKSMGHKAEQFHENTTVEIIWTVIPTIILIIMAIPATKAMIDMDNAEGSDMTIKVTGWQWKWEYEYLDQDLKFFSSLDEESNKARQTGSGINPTDVPHYLLNVDKPLVVPVDTRIRFLFTAADVIHSWWVPALGWKKDTLPGFINEAWTEIHTPGIYRGQCAELCGKDHAFMPIVVIAKEKADYEAWVEEQKLLLAAESNAADKDWSVDDLMAKGKEVYVNNCASCHMEDGSGLAGTFPALSGSSVVTGNIDDQIDLMLNGKGMMPAFGTMLSAVEFASVVTYTRNDLGNNVADSVQPSQIKKLQSVVAVEDEDDEDEG